MKNLILTIDYEIFFGSKTGDVRSCMLDPTYELSNKLAQNNSKMTIFWDVLHYYKLLEYQFSIPEIKSDVLAIEEQILFLIQEGHDVQLHLHPHWLDAFYKDSQWHFNYSRFKLQNLAHIDDPNDINTIIGCVSISKKIMENLIKKIKPDYKVTTFRAGGYLIQPFSSLKDALFKNDITIDTSTCPGLKNGNGIFSYDFSSYPRFNCYKFSDDPRNIIDKGLFFEIPITTIMIPIQLNLYYTFLRHTVYKNLKKELKGSGSGSTTRYKEPILKKLVELFLRERWYQFTTDFCFKEIFHYMINKVDENSTLILHPKLLNNHSMGLINALIQANKVKFKSIKNFIESNLK